MNDLPAALLDLEPSVKHKYFDSITFIFDSTEAGDKLKLIPRLLHSKFISLSFFDKLIVGIVAVMAVFGMVRMFGLSVVSTLFSINKSSPNMFAVDAARLDILTSASRKPTSLIMFTKLSLSSLINSMAELFM